MAGASRAAWTRQEAADAFALHAARVERVAARILRDRDEARDVASETFLALLEGGPDDRQATESWLLTTARNRALNRLRERGRAERAVRHLAAGTPAAAEAPGSPAGDTVGDLVTEAALLIGDRERVAVHMRFTEDRSYDEIASRLGVSAGHARVLVHRALRRLRSSAVALLADRHGAPERCRRALLRGASNGGVAHHGCSPCTAVSDELAALTASGLLPVALPAGSGLLARLFDAPMHALTRLRPSSGRTAEALAALLVTGTVGIGAPTVTTPSPRPASVSAPASGIRALAGAAAHAGTQAAPVAGVPGTKALEPDLVAPDPAGDNQPVSSKDLAPIGVPLILGDPLGEARNPGLDIRQLEIVRLGDKAGKTAGILFRFGLDAPARPDAEYRIDFSFSGRRDCRGSIIGTLPGTTGWIDPDVTVDCPQPGPTVEEAPQRSSPVQMRFHRATLEFTVIFAELDGQPAEMLKAGARLEELRAMTADRRLAGLSSDTAPDYREPGLRYTI